MDKLSLIENGEDLEIIRAKINALIAAYNLTFPVTRSYLDLDDRPALDGKELLPESKMEDYAIPLTSLPGTLDLELLFINTAKAQAEIIAQQVAQQEVANAMLLQNIPTADNIVADDWEVLVYVPQSGGTMELYKTTMQDIVNKAVWAVGKHEASITPSSIVIDQ